MPPQLALLLVLAGVLSVEGTLLHDRDHMRRLETEHWSRVAQTHTVFSPELGKRVWACCRPCPNIYYPPMDELFPPEGSETEPLPMADPPAEKTERPTKEQGGPAPIKGGKELSEIRKQEAIQRKLAAKQSSSQPSKSNFLELAAKFSAPMDKFGCCNVCPDFQSFVKGFRGRPFNYIYTPFYGRFRQVETMESESKPKSSTPPHHPKYPWNGRNPIPSDGIHYSPILPPCCNYCHVSYAPDILNSGRLPQNLPGEENTPGQNKIEPVLLQVSDDDDKRVTTPPPNPKANKELPRARVAETCCKMCVRKHIEDTSVRVFGKPL